MNRKDILDDAIIKCLDEMYRNSQPSTTWDDVNKRIKHDKDNNFEKIYCDKYYLNNIKYNDIINKYKTAYRINNEWISNVEVVEKYLLEGGTKEKYVDAHTDEYGMYHPKYRGYEDIEPLNIQIQNIIKTEIGDKFETCGNKIFECVMNTIKHCKNFYRFDNDDVYFTYNVNNFGPSTN